MPFSCSNCPFIIFAKNAVGYRWYFRLFCRRKLLKVVEGGGNIRHQSKKRPICVSSREGTYYDQISKHFFGEKVMFNVASYYVFFPSEKLTFFEFNLKCQEKKCCFYPWPKITSSLPPLILSFAPPLLLEVLLNNDVVIWTSRYLVFLKNRYSSSY